MKDVLLRAVTTRIRGRVQGVGYRAWTQHTATSLGLSGWVRNNHDGSVTAYLVGDSDVIDQMLDHMNEGPRYSLVEEIATTEETVFDENSGSKSGFSIRESE